MQISELTVDLGERSYPIFIGDGVLTNAKLLNQHLGSDQLFVITNQTVKPLYLARLADSLDTPFMHIALPDGERFKTLETMSSIYDALMKAGCSRGVSIIALGGGVVGDMSGFAAATFQRGVRFFQIPTTLLAQVDSSVGGKTGVNHTAGKNMIGAFYQPKAVFIDTATLDTLPDREFIAGLAEVIKYGLIADRDFLDWLNVNMQKLLQRDKQALQYAIQKSCQCKANVVAQDEHEQGMRAILNLGHTFGHAIETATEYKHWLHGEAVGFGMVMAIQLSVRLGLLSDSDAAYAQSIIAAAGLPQTAPSNVKDADSMIKLMSADKKVVQGRIRLVLLEALGRAVVTSDYDDATLRLSIVDSLAAR